MKCPGQDMRFWKEDAIFEIKCPYCGEEIEFFRDDIVRKCSKCDKRVLNPKIDFGCASYCEYAEICLGEKLKDEGGENYGKSSKKNN